MKKDGEKAGPPPPRPEIVRGKYAGREYRIVIDDAAPPRPAAPKGTRKPGK